MKELRGEEMPVMKRRKSIATIMFAIIVFTTVFGNGYVVKAEENAEENTEETVSGVYYYIDSIDGDDEKSGTSEEEAWKSLDKINATTFQPGDHILFKRGCSWSGQLSPKGSGSEESPIVIEAYGDVELGRPQINGDNWCGENGDDLDNLIFNAAVFFYNQEYWEITGLEVTNYSETKDDNIKKYGILIMGKDAGTLHHMYVRNTYVHDVISIPIGQQAGIGRGGIVYAIRGTAEATNWEDILVEGNYLKDINHYGIDLISSWGSSIFTDESGITENAGTRVNSDGIVIRGNYCENIGNAAICASDYSEALIEYNICNGCNSGPNGNVPIWWEYGEKTICQYNEVFGSGASEGKEDSQAFDADIYTDLNYIQYNYTHDNPSGSFFECSLGTSFETYYRYNISINDGYGTNSYGGGAVITLINPYGGQLHAYNNLIYMDDQHDGYITRNWSGSTGPTSSESYTFTNNVIISETANGRAWDDTYKGTVLNNAYGGENQNINRTDDANAKSASKEDYVQLQEGTSGSVEDLNGEIVLTYGSVDGYHIRETASVIDEGTAILDNGGLDYFGNSVQGFVKPNIGADNSYNRSVKEENSEEKLLLDFSDLENGSLTEEYNYCDFGNKGWNVENEELYPSSYTTKEQANKIALPDKYKITSFEARVTSGTASIKVEAGEESATFSLTDKMTTYKLNFSQYNPALYFVITSENGADQVRIDNIVLTRKASSKIASTNVTYGKEVTASSVSPWEPNDVGSNIVDGDESTIWISNGWSDQGDTLTEARANCVIDLGDCYQLESFDIVFGGDSAVSAWKYTVEGSKENEEWDLLWDQSENSEVASKQSGSIAQEYAVNTYRYLKITFTDSIENAWPALAEFIAYQPKVLQNIALEGTASSSTENQAASNAIDGNESTLWVADGNQEKSGAWWMVDLGESKKISALKAIFEYEIQEDLVSAQTGTTPVYGQAWQYKVEGSTDGESWAMLWDNRDNDDKSKEHYKDIASAEEKYRYVKVTITQLPLHKETQAEVWPAIAEFQILAEESEQEEEISITRSEPGQIIDIDLAYGQAVKASSNKTCKDNVSDRDHDTSWSPSATDESPSLQINLDRAFNLENLSVDFASDVTDYTAYVKKEAGWEEIGKYEPEESGDVFSISESQVLGIKFVFEKKENLAISEVHFDGTDANVKRNRRILVMAPHEDDEMLMAGGVIRQAIESGDEVYVVYATNGDYEGTERGKLRISDTVNALNKIGLEKDHLYFMGYADNGGMGVGRYKTAFTDSFLYNLYVAGDNEIIASRNGGTSTYGNESMQNDYHYDTYGEHATYTRAYFKSDLREIMESVNPTDVYMTSRYDMHYDHAYFGLFGIETISDIQKEQRDFCPTIHEAIIHSHLTDEAYPMDQSNYGYGQENNSYVGAWKELNQLDDKTMLKWGNRESVLVPYCMRQTLLKYNLKDQALREYSTEYYSWIGSFSKVNEVFYKHQYNSIGNSASVSASSERSSEDRSTDQSAKKAIDGIADGYATGLAENHTRFPFAEWVSEGEKEGAWIKLSFSEEKTVSVIKLYDRPNTDDQILAAHLEFDDGTQIQVGELTNDGAAVTINLENPIETKNIKLVVDEVSDSTQAIGLAEIEVYE